jgi:hypothetical protein
MRRILSCIFVVAGLALAGCDSSDKVALPAPAGVWEAPAASLARGEAIQRIELKANGSFVAEFTGKGKAEPQRLDGSWSVGAWQEPSLWERIRQRPSTSEALAETSTGKRAKRTRQALAEASLRYWVPSGSSLAEGAKVVQKKTFGTLGTMTEQWLIEEQGVLVRTADAGGYGILETIYLAIAELMQQTHDLGQLTFNVRGYKFHRV